MFEAGTTSYKIGLGVSTLALGAGAISNLSTGIATMTQRSFVVGALLLALAVLLGFGAVFLGRLFLQSIKVA